MANDIKLLSGRVKKTPATQADPGRYDFLDLTNAEPDLGVPAANGNPLISDTSGNRQWAPVMVLESDQVEILGNLDVQGNITANYFVGNIDGANITIVGNLEADWFIGNIDGDLGVFSGNVTANNINLGNDISAVNGVFSGNITAQTFIGNIQGNIDAGGANTQVQFNDDDVLAGSPGFTFDKTSNLVTVAGNVLAANLETSGEVTATGNVQGANIVTAGDVSTGTVTASGNVSAANVSASGAIYATGNITGGNVQTAGTVSATGNVSGGNLVSAADVTTVTVTASGNISAPWFLGNVQGQQAQFSGDLTANNAVIGNALTAGTLDTVGDALIGGNLFVQGNVTYINVTDLEIEDPIITVGTGANGNALVSDDGKDRGIYMEYYKAATGAGNAFVGWDNNTGNLILATNATVTNDVVTVVDYGSVRGGDLLFDTGNIVGNLGAGNVSAEGSISAPTVLANVQGTSASFLGNVQAGNVISNAAIQTVSLDATANVTANNVSVTNDIDAVNAVFVGNVTANNISATNEIQASTGVFSGNVTADYFIGNIQGNIDAGGANTQVQFNDDDVLAGSPAFTFDRAANLVSVTGNVTAQYFQGNVDGDTATFTGNVSGDTFLGNIQGGSGNFTGTVLANVFTGYNSNVELIAGAYTWVFDDSGNTTLANGTVSGNNATLSGSLDAGNINVTGNVQAQGFQGNISGATAVFSGNVSGGNIVTGGDISATGNVDAGNVNSAAEITAGTTVTAQGNVSGGNITTSGQVVAQGNVSGETFLGNVEGTYATFQGNVTADYFIGNIQGNIDAGGANTQVQFNDGDILNGSAGFTFDKTSNLVTVTGNVSAANLVTGGTVSALGNISGANIATSGEVTALGNVSGDNLVSANDVTTDTVTASGNVSGNNLVSANDVTTDTVTATGNISGGNITAAGSLEAASALISGNVTATTFLGNIQGTSGDFTGTVTANNFVGNVDAGGANTQIQFNDGDILNGSSAFTFDKTSNLVTVAGNVSAANLVSSGVVEATGNVQGGNLVSAADVSSVTVTASGNVSGGNISTAGQITASGNISGSNITASGNVSGQTFLGNVLGTSGSFTANVTANNFLGNVQATVGEFGNVTATGNIVGGNIRSNAALETVSLTVSGTASTANIINSGTISTDTATATGTITANDIVANTSVAADTVTTTGNIQGANVLANASVFATTVAATGNVTANNVNVTNLVDAANIEANYVTAGTVNSNALVGGDIAITASNVNMILTGNLDLGQRWINRVNNPILAQDAATKQYVDDAVSAGLTIHPPVRLESPSQDGSLNATYAQGGNVYTVTDTVAGNTVVFSTAANLQVNDQLWFTSSFDGVVANLAYFVVSTPNTSAAVLSTAYNGQPVSNISGNTGLSQSVRVNSGQGATLTNAGANVALVIDGVAVATNDRVLIYSQTNGYENGVYDVTVPGDAGNAWVLTRSSDMNTYIPDNINGLDAGDYFFVQEGDTGAGESYVMTDPIGPLIIGYSNLTFTQFSASSTYQAGNGLSLNGTIFSVNVDDDTTAIVADTVVVKTGANLVQPNIGNATGNSLALTGNGLITATTVQITGNVEASNVTASTAVYSVLGDFSGNVTAANVNTAGEISATGNVSAGNLVSTNLVSAVTVSALGNVSGNNVTAVYDVSTATVSASGNVTANNLVSVNDVSTVTVTASGNISGANSDISGQIVAQGNVTGGNLVTVGDVTTNTVTATGNVQGGNINTAGTISAQGNITTDGFFIGTFEGNISGNITAPGANTQVLFNVEGNAGTSSALTFDYGANVLSVVGNIDASNVNSSGMIVATGNISGGNIVSQAAIDAQGNITGANLVTVGDVTTNTVTASGNVQGNNIVSNNDVTTVTVTASGNVSGDNVVSNNDVTTVTVTASGNVSGNNLVSANDVTTNTVTAAGNVSGNNIVSANDVTTNTVTAAGNISGANLDISGAVVAVGNVSAGNIATPGSVDAGSAEITGNVTATTLLGNVQGSYVDVAGNVQGGNLVSNADVSTVTVTASGNIEGGNISTPGTISAQGNISTDGFFIGTFEGNISGNITAPGANTEVLFNVNGNAGASSALTFDDGANVLTVVGNISANNISTTEDISATGNVSAANINTTGMVTASGNISADYFLGNGSQLTGIDATSIQNGTSNVRVLQDSDVTVGISGTSNVAVFSTSGLDVLGNVTANLFQGNVQAAGSNTWVQFNDQGILGATSRFTFDQSSNTVIVTGNVDTGNLTVVDDITANRAAFTGNVSVANLTAGGNIEAVSAQFSGNVTAGNLEATEGTYGNIYTGNILSTDPGTNIITMMANLDIMGNAMIATDLQVLGTITANAVQAQASTLTLTSAPGQEIILHAQAGANIDVRNSKIANLANPVANTDAATKQYVDSIAQGLSIKNSVLVATATELPAYVYDNGASGIGATITAQANGVITIDSESPAQQDRVLVKDEIGANAPYNGIYRVTNTGSFGNAWVLTRADDMELPEEFPGAFTFVQEGATQADTGWVCITDRPVVIGNTNIEFTQFSGSGTYQAGNGLSLIGNTFSVNVDEITTTIVADNVVVRDDAVFVTPNIGNATGVSLDLSGDLSAGNITSNTTVTVQGDRIYLADLQLVAVSSNTFGVYENDGVTLANFQIGNVEVSAISSGNSVIGIAGPNGDAYVDVNGVANVLVISTDLVTVQGNVQADYFLGNGSLLTGIDATSIQNGTSRVNTFFDADVTISAQGNSNVVVITGNGMDVTGNISASYVTANGSQLIGINAFGTIQVAGESDVIAESTSDTLTLVAGTGINLLTDAANDAIEISSTSVTSVFATGGNMGFTTQSVTSSETLGLVTALANLGYTLGTIVVDGLVINSSILNGAVSGNKLAANIEISSAGNIVPGANAVFDLGSPSRLWSNLYLDGNTIFLGPLQLKSVDSTTLGVYTADGSTLADLEIGTISNLTITEINNGTTTIGIDGAGGDVYFDIDGVQDVLRTSILGLDVQGRINAAGNITGSYFLGNGSLLTGINASGSSISNGTARVDTVSNGNVRIDAGTQANVAVFSDQGLDIIGTVTATGNVSAANIVSTGLVDAVSAQFSGNVTADYFIGNGSQLTGLPAGYANADAVAYGESGWAGNIIPAANVTYSLGSENNQWAEIWVANNTLYIGSTAISVTGNTLTVAGEPVLSNDSNSSINTSGNIAAANVSAALGVFTDIQGTLVTSSQPNVTAVGTLESLSVSGNVEAGNVAASNIAGTLTTSSQPNITAVGTLTSLSITGNVEAGNVAVTNIAGTVITASQPNITAVGTLESLSVSGNVQAGNVAATLISGTVTTASQPNITSVGTLTALSVTGNVEAGNVTATTIMGTLATANQPNVTAVGTLGTLSVTGNVTAGNVSATNLSGTLATASQPNITDVGTLTALSVSGNLSAGNVITGILTASANIIAGNVDTGSLTASANVDANNVNTDSITAATLTITAANVNMVLAGGIDMNQSQIRDLGAPTLSFDAATKQYVDDAVSSGIHIHAPVDVESPTALPTSVYAQGGTLFTVNQTIAGNTVVFSSAAGLSANDQLWFAQSFEGIAANTAYFVVSTPNASSAVLSLNFNGEPVSNITSNTGLTESVRVNSGVGATLTATANGALTVDGFSVSAGNRVLVYNQLTQLENGVYEVTDAGNVSAPWILTRAADSDFYAPDTNDGIDQGSYYYVKSGDTGAGESYVMTQPTGPFIIGFDSIEFTQFSASQVYTANTQAGISLTGTTFSAKVDGVTTAFDGSGNIKVRDGAELVTPNIGEATGTSLVVSGNVQAGNVTAIGNITGDYILGNGSQLTGIDATSIQNGTANVRTFLNGNVTVSAAGISNVLVATGTGVSVSGTFDATGNVTAGNVAATSIAGTVTTANQPNITGLGTLTALSVTGNVTAGNVAGTIGAFTTVAGTLTTAAQTNVTSLGTLLSLAVTGNVTTGNVSGTTGTFTNIAGTLTTASQTNITAVGNLTTGTWNATTISTARGGTGLTSFTTNGALYATSTSTLTTGTLPVLSGGTGVTTSTGSGSVVLSTSPVLTTPNIGAASGTSLSISGNVSTGNVSGTTGTFTTVLGNGSALTALNANNISSGTLAVNRGGTGATTLTTNNILLGNGTGAVQFVAPGTNGNVLTSNGTTWVSTAPAASGISTGKSIALSMFFGL